MTKGFQSSIKALCLLYVECARNAFKGLVKNWLIIPTSIAAYLLFVFSVQFFGTMGYAGGFILGLIHIVLLTLYYSWLSTTIKNERLKARDLIEFDSSLFLQVISVAFIFFILKFLVATLIQGMEINWVSILLQFGIVIICNTLPEVIYIHRYDSIDAIKYSASFTRENWIEWFIPILIIFSPILLIDPRVLLTLMAGASELLPALPIAQAWQYLSNYDSSQFALPLAIVGMTIANWFMLFRAYLFKELESGAKRRIYDKV